MLPTALVSVFRFVARGFVISAFVLGHFVIWLLGWLFMLLSFRSRAKRRVWFASRLTALIVSLGATYVKVAQIMSTRPDLFPPHIIEALEKLQDDVGAFSFKHVERAFMDEFGKPPARVFAEFDEVPIASASVAQVHHARLDDGRRVAVKVRRPRIDRIVHFDLGIMRMFAKVMSIIPSIRLLAPVESVNEFARAIEMQIDFTIEADNNRRFRKNFGDTSDVEFPELVPELCTKTILTMSFIDGVKVLNYDPKISDPRRLARVGFQTLLKMVFEDGFVHADLHPGNILVTADDMVTILDLGLTAELDDTDRRTFALFFSSWAQGDGKTMARLMFEFSPNAKIKDYDAYEAEVLTFTAKYHGKALGEVEVSSVAFDMMGILRRHRVRVNPTFTMCNIAIAVTEGIGKQLAPELDLISEGLPFFMRLQQEAKL